MYIKHLVYCRHSISGIIVMMLIIPIIFSIILEWIAIMLKTWIQFNELKRCPFKKPKILSAKFTAFTYFYLIRKKVLIPKCSITVTNTKIIKKENKLIVKADLFLKNKTMNKMFIDFLVAQRCQNGIKSWLPSLSLLSETRKLPGRSRIQRNYIWKWS